MIKAIFFDYDGVLTSDKTGSLTICKYISKVIGIDFDLFSQEYRKYNKELLYGKLTHEKIWPELCEKLKIKIDIKRLYDSFVNTPINSEMFDIARKLKLNYKTGIITDNKKDRLEVVIEKQKLSEIFDVIIISAVVGSGKDSEEIFKIAIEEIGCKFNECIFIDNQEKNLIIPNKLGMKTIYYDFDNNNINDLKKELNVYKLLK